MKRSKKAVPLTEIDYRRGAPLPDWVREIISTQLAIEEEDAKTAGAIGFMARALVVATMPYKDPKTDVYTRVNGDFKLRILAGYEGGIPYGIYPRLLMSWVSTAAVLTQSPVVELGDSLSVFLRDVLELRRGGGVRGSATRVTEQMKRLFGSLVTAQYGGTQEHRGFVLRNVSVATELQLAPDAFETLDQAPPKSSKTKSSGALWTPQPREQAGTWKSQVRLSEGFFQECITNPIPIDLRAYKALRESPLAMDIYTWLTYRLSYTQKRSRPIPWAALAMQFGSGYSSADPGQMVRDFKKNFLRALKEVSAVYPKANVEIADNGLVLLPSPPHVLPARTQRDLF